MIYKHVLTEDDPLTIKLTGRVLRLHGLTVKAGDFRPPTRNLSLFLVSRQTYQEAYRIFYRVNIFHFGDVAVLYQFLKNAGLARLQQVQRIIFVWTGDNAKKAFRLLKQCSRLTAVCIILPAKKVPSLPYPREPGYEALREVRGLQGVKFIKLIVSDTSTLGKPVTDSTLESLKQAMTRPRLSRFSVPPDELIDPFKPKKVVSRETELDWLKANSSLFLKTSTDEVSV